MYNSSFSLILYKFFTAFTIVALALMALPVAPTYAAALTVTSNADTIAVDGQCTLREAIINANVDGGAGTTVDCATGAGADVITFNAGMTITLSSALPDITDVDGLTINGGSAVIVDGGGAFRIFQITSGTATFQNITIQNGQITGNGGGVYNNGGSGLTISNVTFKANRTVVASGNDGGAIYHSSGTLDISNSTFTNNYTQDNGGAIYIDGGTGTMTITNSTFTNQNNAAIDAGAAVYLNAGTLIIDNTTFTSNIARLNGGAIHDVNGLLTVTNSTFSTNSAENGGAIYHDSPSLLTVSNSSFIGNTTTVAGGDGGAIKLDDNLSSTTISGSTFTSNTADDEGGAIFNDGEPFTVITSTFTSNVAGAGSASPAFGGAIYNSANSGSAASKISLSSFINNSITMNANRNAQGGAIANIGTIIIANNTFSGNSLTKSTGGVGDSLGGAVYASGVTTIHNATFSGNTVSENGAGIGSGGAIYSAGGVITIANSIVTDGTENGAAGNCGGTFTDGGNNVEFNGGADCGFGITTNPNLGALTGSPQYFPLTSGSSAIDMGSNAICATATSTNNESQNGVTRPVDGDAVAGAICDIGSFEALSVQIALVTNSPVTYNGSPQAAIVTCSGGGAVSDIKYDGSSTIPTNAATYAVTADCAANGSYGSGNDLPAGNFVINTAAQTASVTNSPVTFNGSPQAAVVTCSGGGAVSDIQYDGSSTIPTNAATYTVTADCAATTNYSSGNDLPAGNFVINTATQTASVTNSPVTYNGSPQAAIVTCSGGGAVSDIKYDGSSTIPTNAATYAITADCAANGSYGSENDLPAGNFVIDTATLTVTATSETINYGDTPVFAFTYGAFAGTDDSGDLTTEPTCDAGGGPYTAAGSPYTITCSGGVDDNYDFSYTDGTLTVNAINNVSVTINQSGGQVDPTNSSPISFTVIFGVAVTGFTDGDPGDVSLSGTAGATTFSITEITPNDGTTYHVDVSGMAGSGTVIADIPAGVVVDVDGNGNMASTSEDHTVIYDTVYPVVLFNTDTIPANASVLTVGPSQIKVAFSKDITISSAEDTANYILIEDGVNNIFDTTAADPCFSGIQTDDTTIAINSASYDNGSGIGPYVATLVINGGVGLPVGNYSLFICGTTSIADPSGNKLNDGVRDTALNFSVVSAVNRLPATGFPQGVVTTLSAQPADQTYAAYSDLWLEIPKLSVKTSIVGVPSTGDSWNVSWLGSNSGWLNGSAFPTWSGNSVITAHVWDALNRPGVFANLKNLKYGDQVIVHAFGQAYTYEIRENSLILSTSYSTVFKHEDKSWITLVTCEGYTSTTGEYTNRRMVRAVLVSVASE